MQKIRSSLTKFSVKPIEGDALGLQQTQNEERFSGVQPAVGSTNRRTRGTKSRVAIAVRLGRDDWYRVHDLAVREHESIQKLIILGLDSLMKQRGLPPLSGQ